MEAPLESIRILVVDDEEPIVELLTEYLCARGHRLHSATDGEAALEVLESTSVDLVLTDMKMPRMGGLDLLARIQERGIPVGTILMTGYGTIDTAILAMKHGALDYLLKPFKLREVHAAIVRAAQRLELERETVRLRQVVKLYETVHRAESPDDLPMLYTLLGDVAARELNASGALVAFEEPGLGWVEYNRTPSAPFVGLNLEGLGRRLLQQEEPSGSVWFDGRDEPVIAAPIRVYRGSVMEIVGLLVVCGAREKIKNADQTLSIYAGIVGDALSRQLLSGHLLAPDREGRIERLQAWANAGEGVLSGGELVALRAAIEAMVDDEKLASIREMASGHTIRTRQRWAQILLQRRERFDGYGSPRGGRGDAISPGAQWLAMAEWWEFMTQDRSFAPRLPAPQTRALMLHEAGQMFHAALLERFLERAPAQ